MTVFDQNILARLGITAIVVRAVRRYPDLSNSYVLAQHRMYLPHRGINDLHAFDQNILASIRLYEIWPQELSVAENAVANRNAVLHHFVKSCTCRTLIRHSLFPAVPRAAVPVPPILIIALPVKRAFAGDGDVFLFKSIYERRNVHAFHSFPPSKNRRILRSIGRKLQRRPF